MKSCEQCGQISCNCHLTDPPSPEDRIAELEAELSILKDPSDGRCMDIAAMRERNKKLGALAEGGGRALLHAREVINILGDEQDVEQFDSEVEEILREGGRVVEGSGLENRCIAEGGTESSNLSPSAPLLPDNVRKLLEKLAYHSIQCSIAIPPEIINGIREALLAQAAEEAEEAVHSCHPSCSKAGCVNRRLMEQLAEAKAALDPIKSLCNCETRNLTARDTAMLRMVHTTGCAGNFVRAALAKLGGGT